MCVVQYVSDTTLQACFSSNLKLKCLLAGPRPELQNLQKAKFRFAEFDVSDETDCETAIKDFNDRYSACTTWLNGQYKCDNDKIQHFIDNCPPIVRLAFAKYVSQLGSKIKLQKLKFAKFVRVLRKV